MKTIAIDVMGSDTGAGPIIHAVNKFLETNLDFNFIFVGDKTEINKVSRETERIKIVDTSLVVDVRDGAQVSASAQSSMALAINLVHDGKADAVLSAGSSAAYLTLATIILKRLDGVMRPAFMPIFPTIIKCKRFVMLDVGANIEISNPEILVQWARLGSTFAKQTLKIEKPRVALVNIGTEDNKGLQITQAAHKILKADKHLNYIGFIESRDLLENITDVAVIDGYGGNLVLKTMEGTVLSMVKLIKKTLRRNLWYKLGGLMTKGAYRKINNTLDYRNVGAAWVIGVNGLVIKAHGGSDKKAYLGALKQIASALEANMLSEFKRITNIE